MDSFRKRQTRIALEASAIDLCVGMGGAYPGPAEGEFVDPNFKGDAARIYLSQRCDVDAAFRISPRAGSKSDIGSSENQSAIGIKADSVRVIGTNGIKLVTRPHNMDSRDGTAAFNGIELIAANADDELQYMVKGDNLVESLEQLEQRVADLSSIVLSFLSSQIKINGSLSSHTHTGTGGGTLGPVLTAPSVALSAITATALTEEAEAVVNNFLGRMNLNIIWHNKYLNPMSSKYILSKYNKVN